MNPGSVQGIFNKYCSSLVWCWQKKSRMERFSALLCELPADVHLMWSKELPRLEMAAVIKMNHRG